MGSAAGCAGRTEKRLPGESDPEQRQAGHLGVHPAPYPAGRTSDCSFPASTAAGGSHPTGDAWLLCQIKKIWHKEKGVQGFHLVQSFVPGEISPELAHQIGVEFADRLFGGKFQAVVSTHLNTKCIHNHIVWNSVSMENGKKYRSNIKSSCPVRKLRTVKENIAIFVQLFECISPASGFFIWKKIKMC